MRILLVNWQDIENPQGGGAEIHLHEIFGRLARRGHEITLLCGGWPGCEPRVTLDGMDVRRVGTRQTFGLKARRYFRRHLADAPWDLLVEDINKVPLYTPRWTKRRTAALVPHLFGVTAFLELPAPLAAAVWLAERPLGRIYGRVPFEAISESTRDDLIERGIPRNNITVIYPGIDTTGFTPAPAARAPRPTFAYLGRLKKYKGVHHVIAAFARMTRTDSTLLIAGAGDYRAALEHQATSLDLGNRVRFLGRVSEPEKLALLRQAWGLVFASPKEGWGITNLEAAACATPVVASNSPGIRESVRDGETGFLVPHGDVAAMAASLDQLASSRDLVERLGRNARSFAESFTWERAADETERHLEHSAFA
ncbi:MAG TPA: glycosyltransferase family 4 protein [Gemmatimonadaceae bacterium]|nr:glycosyltransferase family 4 protein [Gemmatimonadaceae bacterium]